ncbi:MAG: polar amino acid transport system substrate-binding protein [Acidimicrobiaceae bacterium]|jgi:polar amino acid transport system substrate-binding protein|nr:polar amino acid transport system substrate-binding protein [Acidimicrobiaceae bacterium]
MIKSVLAGAILLLAVPACAQEFRTAIDGTFAPHAMPSLSGGYEGFNIELANELGKRLKHKITIDYTQYSGILPALQAGTYDFVIAPTTVTKERADNLLFTEGYLNTDFQFLIKKGAPKIDKLEDLKGKTISVNKGSAYDSWARDLEAKIGWKVESYGTQTDAVQAVLVGRADANVAGNTVIAWAAKNNAQVELSYLYSTGLVWAMPLRKDSAELRKQLENAIECMKLDGTIAKLHEKWFGAKPAPGSAAVTVYPGYGVPGMPGYDPTEHTPACN